MANTETKPLDCKQGYTSDNIMMEFAKDDMALRGCNGCSHFNYDGEVCSCDLLNR